MKENEKNTGELLAEIEELKSQLYEATSMIDAIREGELDALVVNTKGKSTLYSLETADYTYRVLIEKFGEGALSISENGLILYCNDYFSKLINMPCDKIVGTYFNSYVDSVGQYRQLQENLSSGLSKGEIVLNVNGVKIPVYVSLTNLQPTLAAIGIIVTDLSEKRKHEEELALNQRKLEIKVNELYQMNSHLEQFIHVISHDIKEPIRKIITYASHLMTSTGNAPEEGKFNNLKIINTSALRLNSLVDDLVKYSLTTTAISSAEVDLNVVIGEVLDDLELIIKETSAKVSVPELPVISGSAVQMRQLFSNIFMNALKYRKADTAPEIKISVQITDCIDLNFPNKKFHKISISDNGIGMDKEHLQKIFTIFQRLHMADQYSGNGIGLAICKKIMENHLGRIDAESVDHNGSAFNLYFPVKN